MTLSLIDHVIDDQIAKYTEAYENALENGDYKELDKYEHILKKYKLHKEKLRIIH